MIEIGKTRTIKQDGHSFTGRVIRITRDTDGSVIGYAIECDGCEIYVAANRRK